MLDIQTIVQSYFADKTIGIVSHTYGDFYMVDVGRATAYLTIKNNSVIDVQFD